MTVRQQGARRGDPGDDRRFFRRPFGDEGVGRAVERVAALDDGDPLLEVGRRPHLDRQAEAVEQLRPQLALLGVAAADQHDARRVADAQPLALDDILARRGDVEQQVDDVILEQVDLVDVEEAAVGARQQPRLEALDPRVSAASRSSAPTTRSSLAPSGRSTNGTGPSTASPSAAVGSAA